MIVSRAVAVLLIALGVNGADRVSAEGAALTLRAKVVGSSARSAAEAFRQTELLLTIEVLRWSTDAERAPLLAALAPPPAPPAAQPQDAGRAAAAGRAGGRGGRGGGRGAAGPASPAERLAAAVKGAPTVGFIWGDGPTGYSIKYAWQATSPDGSRRLVLVTDRRLGAHVPSWPQPAEADAKTNVPGDAELTVIEIRMDGKGAGEGKSSYASRVVVDAEAKTLALDGYAASPVLLKLTR